MKFFVIVKPEKGKRPSYFVEGIEGVKKWSKRLCHYAWHNNISLASICAYHISTREVNFFPRKIICTDLRVQLLFSCF